MSRSSVHTVKLSHIGIVVAFTVFLEIGVRMGFLNRTMFATPSSAILALTTMVTNGHAFYSLVLTLFETLVASTTAILFGLPVALAFWAFKSVRAAYEPILLVLYAVPAFVFYPIWILLLGQGESSIIALAAFSASLPVIVNTSHGLLNVDVVYLKVIRSYGGSLYHILRKALLPAAKPIIIVGIRLAFTISFVAVLTMEYLFSRGGLGYDLAFNYETFDLAKMYGIALFIIVVALIYNFMLSILERNIKGL